MASEQVILQLIVNKYMPMLLFGLEACTLNEFQLSSLDFTINRFLMKLFQTNNIEIVRACSVKRVSVLKFPAFCLKKNGKTIDVFSCVKFMFITCDKKINIVNIFIYAL